MTQLTKQLIAVAGLITLSILLYFSWKNKVIDNYEEDKQVEVKEQVNNDASKIQDTFSNPSDVISNNVDRMLSDHDKDKLWGAELNTTDADHNSEGDVDLGASNGLRDNGTGAEEDSSRALPEIIGCDTEHMEELSLIYWWLPHECNNTEWIDDSEFNRS